MSDWDLWRIVIASAGLIAILIFVLLKGTESKIKGLNTKILARSGVFAAISIILYIIPFFNFNIPFFPPFLNIHFDEVPALIAGFAYGPWSATLVVVAKTIVKLPMTSTLGVGELSDLIISLAFVIPASIFYRRKRKVSSALIGLTIGTLCQLIVASFFTTFVILDFYIFVMGWSEEMLLGLVQLANPAVTSLRWPYFWFVAIPFNLIKDISVVILTFLLYKRMHVLIDKIGAQKN
ncbi:MAG: ECF transporter S component [Bacilli bacterium]|jgi:riboflavin transporter|nr:ECF transporter S component [Bacilli bacterium]MDD3069074.1 ECF transporter S component [Bacilli bacterium]MDD3841229.1 ECF transporter S component [Bacilli bacterium]